MAFDFGSALSGAGTGAITGAQLGGPWGALFGGGLGALSGLFGGQGKKNNVSTFDPRQKQLFDQSVTALQGGGGPLADVYGQYDPALMRDFYEKAYAQPQYQEFERNIVPTITGQFRGKNLQNSSYLGGALAQAGTNVQNNLNAQLAQMLFEGQRSSLDRRSNALDRILNMQTFATEKPQASIFDSLLGSLASGAGDMLQQFLQQRKNQTPKPPFSSGSQPTIGG